MDTLGLAPAHIEAVGIRAVSSLDMIEAQEDNKSISLESRF